MHSPNTKASTPQGTEQGVSMRKILVTAELYFMGEVDLDQKVHDARNVGAFEGLGASFIRMSAAVVPTEIELALAKAEADG